MAIDQKSGNIYFVDDDFEYIYVTDMNGQFLKTLFKPAPERENSSNIRDIALDVKNRYESYFKSFCDALISRDIALQPCSY